MQGSLTTSRIVTALLGACLLAAPASAEERPLPAHQPFKLDAETGCFDYTGTAAVFNGQFKRGAYVSVTMDDPERIPAMDAPEYKTSEPGFWFGPLPKSGPLFHHVHAKLLTRHARHGADLRPDVPTREPGGRHPSR